MKKCLRELWGIAISILLLILICSGFLENISQFFLWLVMINYNSPNISFAGGIIVRILTFAVSYLIVGLVYDLFNYHNKLIMSLSYNVVSIIIGFGLSYIFWIIEKYYLLVLILLFSFALLLYLFKILRKHLKKEG